MSAPLYKYMLPSIGLNIFCEHTPPDTSHLCMPVSQGYDQSVDAPKRFLYYKVLDQSWDPSMPISIAIPTSDKINNKQYEEGYYQVNAAISLVSAFPELVSMTGKNSLAQYDQDKAFNIANLWEFATGTPVINAMVGFQQSKTMLSMSNATPKDGSTILVSAAGCSNPMQAMRCFCMHPPYANPPFTKLLTVAACYLGGFVRCWWAP